MVIYLHHLRPPPRIWRTSPELKKTSIAPSSAGDGVDLRRASLGRRWSRCTTVAAAGIETGMGDVVLRGDRKEER
jgi:hypothetical protein